MAPSRTSSLTLPAPAEVRDVQAARARGERGRLLILWGWFAAMLGAAGYCRALFDLGGDAELLDAVTRTGPLGWGSAILVVGGIGLWLAGNLVYLREAMDASERGEG